MKKKFFTYKVIRTITIGDVHFHIGISKTDKHRYATFFHRDGDKEYAWIRFFDYLFDAEKDVVDRAYREIGTLELNMQRRNE